MVFTHYYYIRIMKYPRLHEVLSQNIYFGTEFKKSQKFLPQKFEAIRYYTTPSIHRKNVTVD